MISTSACMYRARRHAQPSSPDSTYKAEWDNTPLIRRLLELKQEEAEMFGYKNYATMSLTTKMAESPEHVFAFLRELAAKAKPFAERDINQLRSFAKAELGAQ